MGMGMSRIEVRREVDDVSSTDLERDGLFIGEASLGELSLTKKLVFSPPRGEEE